MEGMLQEKSEMRLFLSAFKKTLYGTFKFSYLSESTNF